MTLRILFETGLRISEAVNLQYEDFDFERKCLRLNHPLKNGLPRELKISDKLIAMIHTLHAKNQWFPSRWCMTKWILNHRRILSESQNNPRFLEIHLHSFRHYVATMQYHRTKDILFVKRMLGHRAIQNTLRYTQLIEIEEDTNYVCKVAKSVNECSDLISAGFDYVTEIEGVKLFRKRK